MNHYLEKVIARLKSHSLTENVHSLCNIALRPVCHIAGNILKNIYSFLGKKQICIVTVEGGITSQLEQVVLGKMLEEQGISVLYDLTFYRNGQGLDCLGKNPRNFDILKLDNKLKLSIASDKSVKHFRRFYAYPTNIQICQKLTLKNLPRLPVCLSGYGYGLYSEPEFEDAFVRNIQISYDPSDFGSANSCLLKEIKETENSVGMHVRRGDTVLPSVGRPIPKPEYYLKALSYVDEQAKVYIFSDDMDWVRQHLADRIPNPDRCCLVELNGPERGWCDLILMSACRVQIKSPSGGLGRDAFRLNTRKDKMAIIPAFQPGNFSCLKGNIVEIIIDDEVCDMRYVGNRGIRL